VKPWRLGFWLSVLLSSAPGSVAAQVHHAVPGYTESEIKAAFIVNLFAFIEWPEGARAQTLCVTEQNATSEALQALLAARPELNLNLKTLTALPETDAEADSAAAVDDTRPDCDVVFISRDTDFQPTSLPSDAHILTISDASDFARRGGMVELERRASRVGLVLNHDVMTQQGFSVSSRLLSLARVVAMEAQDGG